MRAEEIDKNLLQQKVDEEERMEYFSIPNSLFALYGIYYDEMLDSFHSH